MFAAKATRICGRSDRARDREARQSMGSAKIAGRGGGCCSAQRTRVPSMARRPHIARGRSGTCARRRARWRGAPFLPAARVVPSSARACAHAWRMTRREGGRSTTTPLPRIPACRMRTYVRAQHAAAGGPPRATELATSEQARLVGLGLSSEQAHRHRARRELRSTWDRTWSLEGRRVVGSAVN